MRRILLPLALFSLACGDPDRDAARAVAGPSAREGRRFQAGGAEWIAVARGPAAALEVLVAPRAGEGWGAPLDPGLAAGGDRQWGVADADGDGSPEVWAGRAGGGRVEVAAYAVRSGALFRLAAPLGARGVDAAQREFSFNVMDSPRLQRWLTLQADSIAAAAAPRPHP